ncbi:MAG: hypothetical protein ACE5JE_01760 [Thermoplasmata archaeon]
MVDPLLPSVTRVVTGEALKGSWWGHPQSHAIFAVVERLEGHGKALQTKLVSGKVTFVHQRLWPALAGAASAREPWQVEGLSPEEERLLTAVGNAGWVRTDDPEKLAPLDAKAVRRAAKSLERYLLVVSREVHTESGAHAKVLETWEAWGRRIGFQDPWKPAKEGKRELEGVLDAMNRAFQAEGRLPWQEP